MSLGLCRVRESLAGTDLAGSDGSGKGSGNAPQSGIGASAPEGPSRREGSEEGCTSQEHPKPPSRAAAGSRLSNPTPKDFAAFAGPQGIVDAAQMAQAASALQQSVQQSGLGPYFMQQAYAPQLARAQLQQVDMALLLLHLLHLSAGPVLYRMSCSVSHSAAVLPSPFLSVFTHWACVICRQR